MYVTGPWIWPGITSCGENNTKLLINEACLEITSYTSNPIQLKLQNLECQGCAISQLGTIQPNTSEVFVLDVSYPLLLRLEGKQICISTKWFDDLGLYSWNYLDDDSCSEITVKEEPEKFWLNVGAVSLTCFTFVMLYKLVYWIRKSTWFTRLINRNTPFQELPSETDSPRIDITRSPRLTRLATVDVFRGIAITLMIFVNYGAGQYSIFKHTPWNGLHVADVVFPFFIWVMGVSTVISLRSQLRASISRKKIFLKVLRRSITLICLGIVLNSGKGNFLRIPGVLQRIGATYFFTASIEVFFGKSQRREQYGWWTMFVELVDAIPQWVVALLLAGLHLALTFALPVPGCPTGYLGPGGLSNLSANSNCTGGAAGYIDRMVFTAQHIYQRPTCHKIYHTHVSYDPEGILGLFNSILLAFLGAHCGRIILTYERMPSRLIRWLLFGIITGVLGGMLCSWSKEYGVIPINKNLWSLSYVLTTSSMAFIVFSVLYWLVDGSQFWSGKPFSYVGMNSITLYLAHEVLNKQLPWRWVPFTSTHIELLVMDVSATACWVLVSFVMYYNEVFISL